MHQMELDGRPDDMRDADHIEHGRGERRKYAVAPLPPMVEASAVERRAPSLPLRLLHSATRVIVVLSISVSLALLFVLWWLAQLLDSGE
jgi:hypothetical protein